MPASESDRGLVLRLTDFSESSQVVTLFTAAHGLVRLMAKGTRRGTKTRFAAGLDLLELGDVSFVPPRSDAGLGTLTEWVQQNTFSAARRDLPRLYGGLYAAELTTALTEEFDPHARLFGGLVDLLTALASDATPLPAIVAFQQTLLESIGYLPSLAACVDCGAAASASHSEFFSSRAGGLICRDCEMHHYEKRSLPAGLAGPEGPGARNWFDLFAYHLRNVAGKEFRTALSLMSVLEGPAKSGASELES